MEGLSRRKFFGEIGNLLSPIEGAVRDTMSILNAPAPDISGPQMSRRNFIKSSAAGAASLYLFGKEIPLQNLTQEDRKSTRLNSSH